MFSIAPSARLRASPFFEATVEEGVTSFTTYNNMLLPTGYGDPEGEYWRLIKNVSQWDVAAERQVQLKGPDAGELARILSPRNLSSCKVGQGKYVPLCNHRGALINDPVLLKLADDLYWFSIADSNIWFWAEAIAAERRLRVEISEPDVSPLAVQGPYSEDVVASLFGDWVRALKYFWFKEAEISSIPVVVARSGWSKQGGFEIYLKDHLKGSALWNIVKEAGQKWQIGPGNPNLSERIESGLLSYGGDNDKNANPFELNLTGYIDLDVEDDVIGIQALREIKAKGASRHLLGVILEDDKTPLSPAFCWHPLYHQGEMQGHMVNSVFSWRMRKNIGFVLASLDCKPGSSVIVKREGKELAGLLTTLPFLAPGG